MNDPFSRNVTGQDNLERDSTVSSVPNRWIYDFSFEELKGELNALQFPSFSTDQIFQWLYLKNEPNIQLWSNISKGKREILEKHFNTQPLQIQTVQRGSDGTSKFLLRLWDDKKIEAVLIPEKTHYTLCVSSQVGCPRKCTFCATGRMGFLRNLSSGEILSQILLLRRRIGSPKTKINIVFMGMGEPLLNYSKVRSALHIITAENGMSISPRNITLSTSGILNRIKAVERDFPKLKISFSLNAPDIKLRTKLMPDTREENLADILYHFKHYKRQNRITFEYILIKGLNDSEKDARQLALLLKGIRCKINLIPLNPIRNFPYFSPSDETVNFFSSTLISRGYTTVIRWSKGKEIQSACGQLTTAES
jgi:23S rRNA (adenine2503-C2)-methyltransferase